MAETYPVMRTDRNVLLVQGDQHVQARLRGWLDGYDGPIPSYRIQLFNRLGRHGGPYTATGPDMFEALVRLRRQLEPEGIMIAVQGCRRDAFPSGMARDMGGGEVIYVIRPGQVARLDEAVDTLADAAVGELATIDEQRAYWEAWLQQRGKA